MLNKTSIAKMTHLNTTSILTCKMQQKYSTTQQIHLGTIISHAQQNKSTIRTITNHKGTISMNYYLHNSCLDIWNLPSAQSKPVNENT